MIIQRSLEWYLVKWGKVSASEAHKIMKGRSTRHLYMCEKAGERMANRLGGGRPVTADMQRGIDQEPEAIREYEVRTGNLTIDGYWIEKQTWGCTPDAFVGDDGLVSIKNPLPKNVARVWLFEESLSGDDKYKEYYWQATTEMLATGRQWCDLALYCKEMVEPEHRMYIHRIERNEEDCERLMTAIDEFNTELDQRLRKIGVHWKFNTEENIRNAEPPEIMDIERYLHA